MDPKLWLLDNRVIRRNLKRGAIAVEAYEKELESLPDLEGQYQELMLEAEEDEDEDDDEDEETPALEAGLTPDSSLEKMGTEGTPLAE